jgi:hypothetical protein
MKQKCIKTQQTSKYKLKVRNKNIKAILKKIDDENKINKYIIDNNIINDSELKNFILFNLLIKYSHNIGLNSSKLTYTWFKNNNYLHFLSDILYNTSFLNEKQITNLSERIYCIIYDIFKIKYCLYCDKYATYKNFVDGYLLHCSSDDCLKLYKSSYVDVCGLSANDKTIIGLKKIFEFV